MKVYRIGPTLGAIAVFLAVSSALLVGVRGGATSPPGDPMDEVWLVYYALRLHTTPPASLDQEGFRELLAAFDADAEVIASRFEVLMYVTDGRRFALELRHLDGTVYRVTLGGVRRG